MGQLYHILHFLSSADGRFGCLFPPRGYMNNAAINKFHITVQVFV